MRRIGIDFGTCYSAIAQMPGRTASTTEFDDVIGQRGIPSAVLYHNGLPHCGTNATDSDLAMRNPDSIIRYMKREIRKSQNALDNIVESGGGNLQLREVIEVYFSYLVSVALDHAENTEEPGDAIITITAPIGINSNQMPSTQYNEFLIDAIKTAVDADGRIDIKKEDINVIYEPVAAGLSYIQQTKQDKDKQTILVFDLGGGTLDITIIKFNTSTKEYSILALEGDLNLGGNDWDAALTEDILKKCNIPSLESFSDTKEREEFKQKITMLKEDLTRYDRVSLYFKYYGNDMKQEGYSRDEFNNVTKELLDRAIEVTNKAINRYGGGLSGIDKMIDKIVLVGGSCNMPQIREKMLKTYADIGEENIVLYKPSRAIALGAAVFSKMRDWHLCDHADNMQITVNSILAHTYGFRVVLNHDRNKRVIQNLLIKNTPYENGEIVVKSPNIYTPPHDYDDDMGWQVYESDSDAEQITVDPSLQINGMYLCLDVPEEYRGRACSYHTRVTMKINAHTNVLELIVQNEDGEEIGRCKHKVS